MIKTTLVCGYEIVAHEKTYGDPAYVCIHKMGGLESSFFTPDEADRFSRAVAIGAQLARRTDGAVPAETEIVAAVPVEIRELLKKIRTAKAAFMLDSGGPKTPGEVCDVIGRWIDEVVKLP